MHSEIVTLEGHLIDSRALSEVLDEIVQFGGDFEIIEVHIGRRRLDRSHARLEVYADTVEQLASILAQLGKHGALVHDVEDVDLCVADDSGTFPPNFYVTTNQPTFVRYDGQWEPVEDQEMDCGILYDPHIDGFRCVTMEKVRRGDRIVCGQRGIKVEPIERTLERGPFQYLAEAVSTDKPKNIVIRKCAEQMLAARRDGRKTMLVAGPAVVHTDSTEHVVKLIEMKLIDKLVTNNALAVHDIEVALFGTSLGVYVEKAVLADTGHEHPIRAINAIRREGGIRAAVSSGLLTSGILHACVQKDVEHILAGSVRDDGPLPETISDTIAAQDAIREAVRDVGFVLMVASSTLSIATAYLLPAAVPVVCVDVNPAVHHKVRERGVFQTISLVTDAEPFFRELVEATQKLLAAS